MVVEHVGGPHYAPSMTKSQQHALTSLENVIVAGNADEVLCYLAGVLGAAGPIAPSGWTIRDREQALETVHRVVRNWWERTQGDYQP